MIQLGYSRHVRPSADTFVILEASSIVTPPKPGSQAITCGSDVAILRPDMLGYTSSSDQKKPWTSVDEAILTAPYDYLVKQPGKDIRSKLIGAFNVWLKAPLEKVATIMTG